MIFTRKIYFALLVIGLFLPFSQAETQTDTVNCGTFYDEASCIPNDECFWTDYAGSRCYSKAEETRGACTEVEYPEACALRDDCTWEFIQTRGLSICTTKARPTNVPTEEKPSSCSGFSKKEGCTAETACYWQTSQNRCLEKTDQVNCSELPQQECGPGTPGNTNYTLTCRWSPSDNRCLSLVEFDTASQYGQGGSGILPDCAVRGTCRDVNDLLKLAINVAQEAFKYLGVITFLMFVYGGFTMVLSFGNAERFKKGQSILVAAVVGMIIAFSAYILIDFILNALNVSGEFRDI